MKNSTVANAIFTYPVNSIDELSKNDLREYLSKVEKIGTRCMEKQFNDIFYRGMISFMLDNNQNMIEYRKVLFINFMNNLYIDILAVRNKLIEVSSKEGLIK